MHKNLIIVLNQTVVGLLCWNLRKNTEKDLVHFSKEYHNTLWLSVILIWRFNLVLKVTKKIQIWKLRIISLCFFLEESLFKSSYTCVYLHLCVFYLCVLYACVHMSTWVCLCVVYTCICTCSKLMGIYVWYIYAYVLIYGVCTMFLCMCIGGLSYLCSQRLTSDVLVFSSQHWDYRHPFPYLDRMLGIAAQVLIQHFTHWTVSVTQF